KECPALQSLDLSFTSVTDAGLKELKGCNNLHTLNLLRTQALTDKGLGVLLEIGLLHTLVQASGEGGKRPANIDEIRTLDLTFTDVTDAGLNQLKTCPNLQLLNLSFTKITDEGMRQLKECKSLQLLYLESTEVTDEGQQELQAALPNLTIAR